MGSNVLIVGAGKVGTNLYFKLQTNISDDMFVVIADSNQFIIDNIYALDLLDFDAMSEFIIENSINYVINTTGVRGIILLPLIELCNEYKVHYIDINYDDDLMTLINNIDLQSCVSLGVGVTPGITNIVAADLVKTSKIDELHLLEIHAGCLSKDIDNSQLFVPTYAPIDICDEYTKLANFVEHGQLRCIEPFKNGMKKDLQIDNIDYEAFLTADGISTFFDTFKEKVPNIIFRSLRKPGHYAILSEKYTTQSFINMPPTCAEDILLFFDTTAFHHDLENLVIDNVDDNVIIYVTIGGIKNVNGVDVFRTEYSKLSYSRVDFRHGSAIDNLTAMNIITTLRALELGVVKNIGILKQETIPYSILSSTFNIYM